MRPPGGRTQRDSAPAPEKRHSRGEGRRAGKGLARIGGREYAAHEPLISSVIVAEVPLAGLSFLEGGGQQWAPKRKFGFDDNRFMVNRGAKHYEDTPNGPRADMNVAGADEKTYETDWVADKTVEFIDKNKDVPFCYMVSIHGPHGPDLVREPYNSMYSKCKFALPHTMSKPHEDAPSWAKPETNSNNTQGKYHGMVKCIDDNVGKILKALKKNGIIDNTIVVFTSDHGDMRGEHGRQDKSVPLEAEL
jgi:arylsulfatase A-like enzyme